MKRRRNCSGRLKMLGLAGMANLCGSHLRQVSGFQRPLTAKQRSFFPHRTTSDVSVCKPFGRSQVWSPQLVLTTRRSSPTALRATAFNAPLSTSTAIGNMYMVLLALQFAFQPIVTRSFASKSLIKGTYVFSLDVMRALICLTTLWLTGSWAAATAGWNWQDAAMAAGLPSMLYVAQNYFALQAYQNLSPITFNVLNQTKTLSAALWCFLLLGQRLDIHQVGALGVLLLAALVMEKIVPLPFARYNRNDTTNKSTDDNNKSDNSAPIAGDPWIAGIVPVLLASLLSGLAGALAQRALQARQRNSLLFSLELASCSILTSTVTLGILPTPNNRRLTKEGWWKGWTAWTWAPLILQAVGGVLVGLVTKYAGSVRKGFCLIQGMFLSGLLQNWFDKEGSNRVRLEQWVGGVLAALSFWMYTQ